TRSYGDWSSDVCSSDLPPQRGHFTGCPRSLSGTEQDVAQAALGQTTTMGTRFPLTRVVRPCLSLFWRGGRRRGSLFYHKSEKPEIGRASCRERVVMSVG